MLSKSKAQIFSLDIIIAVVVFIIIMLGGIWTWDYTREKMHLSEARGDLEIIARNSLNVLLQTPGNPSNWTNASDFGAVKSLGLANNYLVLDGDKINRMISLNSQYYSTYKRMLGVLGPNYEFQLRIRQWNGTAYEANYEIGSSPSSNAQNIVRADRFALLDGAQAHIIFYVWQECAGARC